jgi:tetratricopeptide (TPR) repeat protein
MGRAVRAARLLLVASPLWPGTVVASPAGASPLAQAAPSPSTARSTGDAAVAFDEAARRAAAARDAGDVDEAIRWYRQATALRPGWDEGWWHVGALSYDRRRAREAAAAFARFVTLKPDSGPGWAMRGLAEFDAGRHEAAGQHLAKGLRLGSVGNLEIRNSVYHTLALLHIRGGHFELAVEPLATLARTQPESASLVAACGLLLLRMAHLPSDIPADRREVVEAAGRAAYAAMGGKPEARERFEEALRRFPSTPGLHYGYGGYLRQQGADESRAAIEQFEKEIEVDPKAVYPRLEIAFELMKQGEHEAALPYARDAAGLAPALFVPHFALGRALIGAGQLEAGIAAFEKAVSLAPDVPEARAALARAYVQAGRPAEAAKQKIAFQKLQAEQDSPRLPAFAREDAGREVTKP